MKKVKLALPQLAVLAGTRGIMGAGAGLLLAKKLSDPKRKSLGWTLFCAGALSTIPLAMKYFGRKIF